MNFLDLAKSRFSAKSFDDRDISEENLRIILEAGVFAPSSFGLEPWKFVVYTKPSDLKHLTQICFNQENVATSKSVITIMGMKNISKDFATRQVGRFNVDDETRDRMVRGILSRFNGEKEVFNYTSHQCYFAGLQMALAAKDIGIDSCLIGGFDSKALEEFVGLTGWGAALVLALGYGSNGARRRKLRLDFDEVVDIR